jgi:hypothetical protein
MTRLKGDATTARTTHFDQPVRPDWGWALSRDPNDLVELLRAGRANIWLERLLRGLDARLGGVLELPAPTREAARTGCWLPADVVPIVGALPGGEGALGIVRLNRSEHALSSPELNLEQRTGRSGDSSLAARDGVALVTNMLAELLPNAPRPLPELSVGRASTGDSVALPSGVGALLQLFGVPWPEDLIVTGGIDLESGCFTAVPSETLPGKLAALKSWGFTRIGLVSTGMAAVESLSSSLDGVRVESLPSDPAELPAALAGLEGIELREADVARALALFDLRVGRAGPHLLDRVLETTAVFVEHGSPLVRHLAHDMRSRALLHAGRSDEARTELEHADRLHGQGDLPDGRLRDVLRYQQGAHRSVVHLDLGDWSDDHPAHQAVDVLISELDGRWDTRHERLMRIFLANTRARRMEYLGRLDSEASRFDRAWSDLIVDRDRWTELLEDYAIGELHLRDTSRARIENQLVDIAASRVACGLELPADWLVILEEVALHSSPVLVDEAVASIFWFHFDDGSKVPVGGDGFNALARLRRHRALGAEVLPPELKALQGSSRLSLGAGAPGFVPHPWFVWFEQAALLAREHGSSIPLPDRDETSGYPLGWAHLKDPGTGIMGILALRSRLVLESLGFKLPRAAEYVGTASLAVLHEDLASRPGEVWIRAPY